MKRVKYRVCARLGLRCIGYLNYSFVEIWIPCFVLMFLDEWEQVNDIKIVRTFDASRLMIYHFVMHSKSFCLLFVVNNPGLLLLATLFNGIFYRRVKRHQFPCVFVCVDYGAHGCSDYGKWSLCLAGQGEIHYFVQTPRGTYVAIHCGAHVPHADQSSLGQGTFLYRDVGVRDCVSVGSACEGYESRHGCEGASTLMRFSSSTIGVFDAVVRGTTR